jgi:glycosyltransferase involved in cell wall biosynthesis
MRIVFGINNFDNAGAENFMLRLAKYFSFKGHEIALFSLLPIEEKHLNRVKIIFGDAFSSVELIGPYLPNRFLDFFLWKMNRAAMIVGKLDWRKEFIESKTKQKIINFKPDLLNSHLFETDDFFSKDLTIPHVISMHGPYEYYLYKVSNDDGAQAEILNPQSSVYNQTFIKEASRILNSSKNVIYCADKNLEIFNHVNDFGIKKQKIYYGFEKKDLLLQSTDNSSLNLGMFARGVKSKGWEILLDAFIFLETKYSNLNLILAYSETDYMSGLKKKYEANKKIHFLGLVDPIENIINEIDIVVFPTFYPGESLPNTIIESLFYLKPIISTDLAEISKMLTYQNKSAGQIIPIDKQKGTPHLQDLIDSIELYINDEQILNEHKHNCLTVSKQFSFETCYQSYLNYFLDIT